MSPSSPLLDQYNRDGIVTPALQRALDMARQTIGANAGLSPTAAPAGPAPRLTPSPSPAPALSPAMSSAPSTALLGGEARPESQQMAVPQPMSTPEQHQQRLTDLTTGEGAKAGVDRIKNPWLRAPLQVLSAIGDGFFGGITQHIPGGELHHQGLVNMARQNVNQDEAQATAAAGRAHLGAETEDLGASAEHKRAQAEALLHPPAKEKTGDPTKTIETADGIMQFNPESGKYDIPVGEAPGKNSTQHVVSTDGSVLAIHTDAKTGKTTHEVIYHGDPKVDTDLADLEVNGKPHKVIVNKRTGETIRDLGPSGIKPPTQDYGTNFIDPATNTVVRVRPGQQAPAGGLTPSGFGGANAPTAASKTVADQAKAIRAAGDKLIQEIDAKKGKLGNLGSYFNQFINGTPIADKDVAGLMTSLSSFAALQPKLHGFRSHDAMKEFSNIIGGIPKDPEALKSSIRSIQSTAEIMERMGNIRVPGESGAGGQAPTVTTKAEFDALPSGAVYLEDGKRFKKP